MTTPIQVVMWTALPNGISGNVLSLSVFVSPQLNPTTVGPNGWAPLSDFPDFVDWPSTISSSPGGPVSFDVTFAWGTQSVTEQASNATGLPQDAPNGGAAWSLIFDESNTAVKPFASFPTFTNPDPYEIVTFPATEVAQSVQSLYASVAGAALTSPFTLTTLRGGGIGVDPTDPNEAVEAPIFTEVYQLISGKFPETEQPQLSNTQSAIEELLLFHRPPGAVSSDFEVELPVLDFHQALSSLGGYPAVLRLFGLAFDLTVPMPDGGLPSSGLSVYVTPTWTSQPGAQSVDFTPKTACTVTSSSFVATPASSLYTNRMLDLSNAAFSVTDLDTDLAGERLASLSRALQTMEEHFYTNPGAFGAGPPPKVAMPVPAVRSIGPQVLWSGYGTSTDPAAFSTLLNSQADVLTQLTTWLSDKTVANLPTLSAEQVTRGHRFDIYAASDAKPKWWSLCGRYGTYVFGTNPDSQIEWTETDEGVLSPAASQTAGIPDAPQALYVHENIVRWAGWGLSCQRPGGMIATDDADGVTPNPGNTPPAQPEGESLPPQMGVTFVAPALAPSPGASLLFPRLRFGNQYQFRARAVDLAGNSLPLSSKVSSTATPLFTHYRYDPVRPPTLTGIAPFTPGESTLYLVLLDDQVDPVGTNGRWLFPPSTSQLMAEEHGMFDGFVSGEAPNPADPPAPAAWPTIAQYDAQNLGGVTTDFGNPDAPLIGTYDANNNNVPYFTGDPMPYTPYLPDPMSFGPALLGMPGNEDSVMVEGWSGTWPVAAPILLTLGAGDPSSAYTPPGDTTPGTFAVTLPQAAVGIVRISSGLPSGSLGNFGLLDWASAIVDSETLQAAAYAGQVWQVTPYQYLRMVHAVRVPLRGPQFGSPNAYRSPGATSVDIEDPQFLVDQPSTAHLDVSAVWSDPYDNPADPDTPEPTVVTTSAYAFRLTVSDPSPTGPEALPLTPVYPGSPFQVAPTDSEEEGATHHIGDTLHHTVYYTATGASRFADLFTTTVEETLTVGTPVVLSTETLGLTGPSVVLRTRPHGSSDSTPYTQVASGAFTVNQTTRQVTLTASSTYPAGSSWDCLISYQPTTTLPGEPVPIEVLSSTRPLAPVISEVVPAWQLFGPAGSLADGEIAMERTGGFLRVYLERPWYSTGAGELLGVVTPVVTTTSTDSVFPAKAEQSYVTMMGLDPINYVNGPGPWPVVPTNFTALADVPDVPYRAPYASPPQVYLVEDNQQTPYQVWPYDVHFDSVSNRWYADVAPRPGVTDDGTYLPPPGYFIRLALCRFQPWSQAYNAGSAIEASPVVTATICQPVPDRTVVVVPTGSSGKEVLVAISGPAYQGFRPPNPNAVTKELHKSGNVYYEYDGDNAFAPSNPDIYKSELKYTVGKEHTSTMVVQVQVQSPVLNKMGLEDDLAWEPTGSSFRLPATFFAGNTTVIWGSTDRSSSKAVVVSLPDSVTSSTKMRLRISELDYYTGSDAPDAINSQYRRPFVALIPLN